jgi:hypothetical protein
MLAKGRDDEAYLAGALTGVDRSLHGRVKTPPPKSSHPVAATSWNRA